ncbi:complement receptor type 1-like isoform X2 [Tachyglossus aculeatus]|uniref:complement receptor type 1-like isoform X2 n=1 Tax=Tachyglossus aculeatus TaxID=9261 RepID=UPI0018F6D727|nr:complement receptor type 1-like isoform X2 [Tachyglossus aculeatus]
MAGAGRCRVPGGGGGGGGVPHASAPRERMGASPPPPRRPGPALGLLLLLGLLLPRPPAVDGDCGVPKRLTSAQLKEEFRGQQKFPHGAQVLYECRPGYSNPFRKPVNITCLEDDEWSSISEFCERRSCLNPGTPPNGRVDIPEDLKFGSQIHYTCEEGFKLIGSPTSTCELVHGKVAWSEDEPICEAISCLPPPKIAHGTSNAGDEASYPYGSAVTYECEHSPRGSDKYSLIGNHTISCTLNSKNEGVWSSEPPRCEVVKCTKPAVSNGKITSVYKSEYNYRDTAMLECNSGYVLRGQSVIVCEVGDKWSPAIPVCEEEYDLTNLKIPNGKVLSSSKTVKEGDIVTVECDSNYSLEGSRHIKYIGQGNWEPKVPTCTLKLEYDLTNLKIPNGKVLNSSKTVKEGDVVTVECDSNYSLEGSRHIKYIGQGNWEPKVPTCTLKLEPSKPPTSLPPYVIDVIKKPEVPHGQVIHPSPMVKKGENITIECDPGYTLKGSSQIQYLGGNKWNPDIPTCNFSVVIIIILVVLLFAFVTVLVVCLCRYHNKRKGKSASASVRAEYSACHR